MAARKNGRKEIPIDPDVSALVDLQKLEDVLSAVGDGVSVQDRDFKILYQNQIHKDMIGDHRGEYCYVAYEGRDHVCDGCPLAMTFRDGKIHTRERDTIAKNEMLHVEITSSPLRDSSGKIVGGIEVVRDITKRKRAEEELRRSEERFRSYFELGNIGMAITSTEKRFLMVNDRLCEILGYGREELLTMTWEELTHPDDLMPDLDQFNRVLCGEIMGFQMDKRYIRKNGKIVHTNLTVACKSKPDGSVEHYINSVQDITEKIEMERELIKAQKLESLGTLAGGIAHDFNNLLTAILGNITVAKMVTTSERNVYDRLEEAEKATLRSKDLTAQLLTFSGGGSPVKKIASIGGLIRDSAEFILSGSNVKCEFAICDDLHRVEIDEAQIVQVINNIVINANQAMVEGGTIKIIAENVSFCDRTSNPPGEGEYVKISFTDHGVGIPAEYLTRIFDPYFTTKQKGSGLGLSITYSIIKNHGGHIEVESKPGEETAFHVYIPVSKKKEQKEHSEEIVARSGKGRILVMDDEEIVREVVEGILETLGYEVGLARDGIEAIGMYQRAMGSERPFDAVIMDLTIPGGMGGVETIGKLREIDPSVKAIVSSGYANAPIMAQYKDHGFFGVLTKPYTVAELSATLHTVMADNS